MQMGLYSWVLYRPVVACGRLLTQTAARAVNSLQSQRTLMMLLIGSWFKKQDSILLTSFVAAVDHDKTSWSASEHIQFIEARHSWHSRDQCGGHILHDVLYGVLLPARTSHTLQDMGSVDTAAVQQAVSEENQRRCCPGLLYWNHYRLRGDCQKWWFVELQSTTLRGSDNRLGWNLLQQVPTCPGFIFCYFLSLGMLG